VSIQASVIRKRARGLVWFGALSYRRMHITYEAKKMLCPHCQHELEPMRYFGSKIFQKDTRKSDYKSNFWTELYENGEKVWFPATDLLIFH
jgi:hypothetical protein